MRALVVTKADRKDHMKTQTAILALTTLSAIAAAYPPGWSLHTFPSAANESKLGETFLAPSTASVIADPALFLGVNNAAATRDFREVRFAQSGDIPTSAQFLDPQDSRSFRRGEAYPGFLVAMEYGDFDGDGIRDDVQLRVWNYGRDADGNVASAPQTVTRLVLPDVADATDFALIPAAGSNWTGVITSLAAAPANPRTCPVSAQRFAIGPTGISRVGTPVVLASVDITQTTTSAVSTRLRRQPDTSVSVVCSVTHLRSLGASAACGPVGTQVCISNTIATGRIGGGQLTPVARETRTDSTLIVDNDQRTPLATALTLDDAGCRVYFVIRGKRIDRTTGIEGFQRRIEILGNNITAIHTGVRGNMEGAKSNPLYQSGGPRGENPLHQSRAGGLRVHVLGVPGLLAETGEEMLGLFNFPLDVNMPPTADTTTFRFSDCCVADCIATAAIASRGDNGEAGDRLLAIGAPMYGRGGAVNVGAVLLPDDLFGAPICPSDFDQSGGVDGEDVQAFFVAWSAADQSADFDANGGVDGADVEAFFVSWSAGC